MNRPLRFLLGVGIVAILAPATAMVLPDGVTGLIPWHSDVSTARGPTPALAAVDREIQLAETESTIAPTTRQRPSSQDTPPTNEANLSAEASTSTRADEPNDSTTTVGNDHSSDHDSTASNDDNGSTKSQDPTSTTKSSSPPKSSTTATSSQNISGTIRGQACPCTVTGTVELKGKVSLQGDLMVEGGTLVARPGVDVNGNGFQIMFMNGGKADFQGSKVFTWSDRGAKQNLERDVVFRDMRRIMFHHGAGKSILRYFTVRDSGVDDVTGDYPIHFHLNGNSTRGTLVEGVVVVNGQNHAYVPHGSNGITFRDVIAKHTKGQAFWWDPPGTNCSNSTKTCTFNNSNDIVYDHVLVDGVTTDSDGHRIAGFVMGAGSNNIVRNSVAINIEGGQNCAGFQWPESANKNVGGTVWSFKNNFSQSARCHGIFVWQNDGDRHHVIDGFVGDSIDHGAYSNNYEYRNIDVPKVQAHAGGWSITSGRIGVLELHTPNKISPNNPTLTVSNTEVNNIVVNIKSSDRSPRYEFSNIGLTCSDITYEDTDPTTAIFIDGTRCNLP